MRPNWKKLRDDAAFRGRMETRRKAISAIRRFFEAAGFIEVETPIVVRYPGMEPNLDPFETAVRDAAGAEHVAGLITSPEYQMKKLLAAGYDKIFEIIRAFRNKEPWKRQPGEVGGVTHNPEFTMIEWYRAAADYRAIMEDCERMVVAVAQECLGTTAFEYAGQRIDVGGPWERITVAEAFQKYCGIDLAAGIDDPERFKADVVARGCPLTPEDGFDEAFFKIFLRDIEPKLGMGRPTILYDYPRSMAALARVKPDDARFAERFEVYCAGMELGNAFSELNDAVEQRKRLEKEQEQRRREGKRDFGIDEQFIEAVGMMPESAGIAFGVDRLVLLLTNSRDIREVLFFPAEDLFA